MSTDIFDLTGEVALVTGASRGLGRSFATTLAKAGAKVALAARSTDDLKALAGEIKAAGGEAVAVRMDVTDSVSVEAAVAEAETALGPITVLVNNSGVATTASVLDQDEADWDSVIDVNLKGVWLVARAVGKRMAERGEGGSIINIASIASVKVLGRLAAYCASKAAVAQLTKSMAVELARQNIRVNAIAPGYIETDMNRDFFHSPAGQTMIKQIPQRRLGQPEDLDGVLLLLASPKASAFMTGSLLVVDGGHSIG